MTTNIPLTTVITRCPAPVDAPAEITDGLLWIDFVNVWVRVTDEEIPNKQYIINLCDLYAPKFYINSSSSDYDDVNDMLMHVKSALMAVQTVDEGITLQGGD